MKVKFGYHPWELAIKVGAISVESLADREDAVARTERSSRVDGRWFYAPPDWRNVNGVAQEAPYRRRIFPMPQTHTLEHVSSNDPDHLAFLLWALSFFTGMRLTATDAGFVDATPIEPGLLVDFHIGGGGLNKAVKLADDFWSANRASPKQCARWSAVVHALFLSQTPQLLQFEEFLLLYAAFDACYAIAKQKFSPPGNVPHALRVEWMCQQFAIPVPTWAARISASPKPKAPEVADIRNETFHEALFMGKPLGFALHGLGTSENITLEMRALVCRLLLALIGCADPEYIQSSTGTRSRFLVRLN